MEPPASFKVQRPRSSNDLAGDSLRVMWQSANFYEDEATYRLSVSPATPGQLAVYACSWYLSEVNNGGHSQFFYNSTGMVWEDALRGFELLDAPEYGQILADAVTCFPDSRPSKAREERCSQIPDPKIRAFDKLDKRVYALNDDFDILAAKYILAHPDEFFENP